MGVPVLYLWIAFPVPLFCFQNWKCFEMLKKILHHYNVIMTLCQSGCVNFTIMHNLLK